MAGKRRRYILTETAEQDFREARGWSLSRWGRKLTKQYFTDLHECAERIARNSGRFAPMERVPNTAELSVYPIREHYLVYVPIREKRIAIVALIRQTRDVPAILNANGFVIRRQLKKILAKPAPVNSAGNSFFFPMAQKRAGQRSGRVEPRAAKHGVRHCLHMPAYICLDSGVAASN